MATLLLPKAETRYGRFGAGAAVLEGDAQSEEGRKVSEEARHLWRYWSEQVLRDALERYRRPDGYEGYLVEAAWQLEQIGREAWPVLRNLVLEAPPECEYFLGAVVRLEGVAPRHRLTALLAAARNPDANVRSRLLELFGEMPRDLRTEVLRELTAEGRPDDGVTDRAREIRQERSS